MISINTELDKEIGYNEFLEQFFNQCLARLKRDWNEELYLHPIKQLRRSNIFFKKFLLTIRMFFFKIFKNNNSEKGNNFKHQIGKFSINIRQLQTGKSKICKNGGEKREKSLAPVVSLIFPQKVRLIEFQISFSEERYRNFDVPIGFSLVNFSKKLSEFRKRIYLSHPTRFSKKRILEKTINNQIIEKELIVLQLF
jgi:hypothetical protein